MQLLFRVLLKVAAKQAKGDYDLAGFAVGAAERGTLLPAQNLSENDVILGLKSSGVHSNGFSLVRHIVNSSGLDWHAPAPFQQQQSLAEALLTPTRIYVRSILSVLREHQGIKALAHITGGGFPENIPRVLPNNLTAEIDLSAITVPPVFSWLSKQGNIAAEEMLRTFNCGVGMIVVVDSAMANSVEAALTKQGESVFRLGKLIKRDQKGVSYKGELSL